MNRDEEEGGGTISKEMEFLQQFEAVPLVELPIAVETKGETTAEGEREREREIRMEEWWDTAIIMAY